MNEKITLPRLARLIAQRRGLQAAQCEQMLKRLFVMVSESLAVGEPVRLKGFGTFKISHVKSRKSVDVTTGAANEIPAHDKVVFIPSKEMASAVNAPFEMFDSVEISEEMATEEWTESESMGEDILADDIVGNEILEREKAEAYEEEVRRQAAEALHLPEPDKTDATEVAGEPEETVETGGESETESPETEGHLEEVSGGGGEEEDRQRIHEANKSHGRRAGVGRGIFIGVVATVVVLLIAALGLYVLLKDKVNIEYLSPKAGQTERVEAMEAMEGADMTDVNAGVADVVPDVAGSAAEAESEAVPTHPSDENKEVTDTITKTRYLTTMAKDHYGNFHLWPYIYEANKKILGHPDRIKPGTKVVIPPLSRYGVDPKNPEDIAKAKRMGAEIYARYQ